MIRRVVRLLSLSVSIAAAACAPGPAHPDDVAALQTTVKSNVPAFTACYEDGRKNNPTLGGTIALKMTILENGSVEDIVLAKNDLGDAVGACFIGAFMKTPFPRISRDTAYEESFCFEPDPKGLRCRK